MNRYLVIVLALFWTAGCASKPETKTEVPAATEQATQESSEPEYADTGEGEKLGSLPQEMILLVVRQNRDSIRSCYQRHLQRDPSLSGKVVVQFKIVRDGTVSRASITETTLGNVHVESCIRQEVQSWVFMEPEGGGHVIVNYPFNLHG